MKTIDLGLTREILGRIVLSNQDEIKVMEPFIEQILQFEGLRGRYMTESKKLEEEGNFEELFVKNNEFFIDEIITFVPELKRADVLKMTRKQRESIMSLIFPPEEKEKERYKKKRGGRSASWLEMIGHICSVFKGFNLPMCLKMTKRQIRLMFGESWRQEARQKIRLINCLIISKMEKDDYERTMMSIKFQAYPPDPEEDGDMDTEQILKVKAAFEAQNKRIEQQRKKGSPTVNA